jgi:membrane-bound ClpP family serine protease
MNEQGWSARVVVSYILDRVQPLTLLVLILTLVRGWVDIPLWLVWGVAALWVVKDVALFPFVWRAYDSDRLVGANSIVGARGIAKDRLAPSGYVWVRGELWRAEVMGDGRPIDKGEGVRVQGIRGFRLLVQANSKETG